MSRTFNGEFLASRPIDSIKRGQINLIDFQSCPDGEYKWLLHYQDCVSTFSHLKPIKSRDATTVAKELSQIFFTFGVPNILHNDGDREFTSKVINELLLIQPEWHILNGKQILPDTTKVKIEKRLRDWMTSTKSNHWSRGCYKIQGMRNVSSYDHRAKRPSLEAAFESRRYDSPLNRILDGDTTNQLHTEENLETALNGRMNSDDSSKRNQDNASSDQSFQGSSDTEPTKTKKPKTGM